MKTDKKVTFKVALKKGECYFQTWFIDTSGEEFGAYYVYIKRIGSS